MAIDNDDRDEESAALDDEYISIERCVLGSLMMAAGDEIPFEDHGYLVVVSLRDIKRLRRLAYELDCEMRSYDDDDSN